MECLREANELLEDSLLPHYHSDYTAVVEEEVISAKVAPVAANVVAAAAEVFVLEKMREDIVDVECTAEDWYAKEAEQIVVVVAAAAAHEMTVPVIDMMLDDSIEAEVDMGNVEIVEGHMHLEAVVVADEKQEEHTH